MNNIELQTNLNTTSVTIKTHLPDKVVISSTFCNPSTLPIKGEVEATFSIATEEVIMQEHGLKVQTSGEMLSFLA